MVVLSNLPPTIAIERGLSTHCDTEKERNAGCASKWDDFCYISLSRYWPSVETLLHELAHCTGADEKQARELE